MGVPALFKWLNVKHRELVKPCTEELYGELPFDNLYLDMNGIIHPCTHPENRPAPQTEQEMFDAIFAYIEKLLAIVRPKKLLYLAIDGVAPRAKMNQQRSRRFRAVYESNKNQPDYRKGLKVPKRISFDSNCITPGTPFMSRLTEALKKWINEKLASGGVWQNLAVLLSDASVPGEGEHKVMDFIRRQKADPKYNSKTQHCLFGSDADLIMLGLATHEPYFTILREVYVHNDAAKFCKLCNKPGHSFEDCFGEDDDSDSDDTMESETDQPLETKFQYIRINYLRRTLEDKCAKFNIKKINLERFIDDYVFLCFFVGNDFLPNLPALKIKEDAIDRLIRYYKKVMPKFIESDIYLTKDGFVNFTPVQKILDQLADEEGKILKKREESHQKTDSREIKPLKSTGKFGRKSHYRNQPIILWEDNDELDPELTYSVEGPKEKYYLDKFYVDGLAEFEEVAGKVTAEYVKGLAWVMQYYYQDCPDWGWFYPFHFAPYAAEFKHIHDIDVHFDKFAKPFKPLEQLMAVLPPQSAGGNLPPSWHNLMTQHMTSSIIDFYPKRFAFDHEEGEPDWKDTVILPFIHQERLAAALKKVYVSLTKEESARNTFGQNLLFFSKQHSFLASIVNSIASSIQDPSCFVELTTDSNDNETEAVKLIAGTICLPSESDPQYSKVFCTQFNDPKYSDGLVFPSVLLLSNSDTDQFDWILNDNNGRGKQKAKGLPPSVNTQQEREKQNKKFLDNDFQLPKNRRANRSNKNDWQPVNANNRASRNDRGNRGRGRGNHRNQKFDDNYRGTRDRNPPNHQYQAKHESTNQSEDWTQPLTNTQDSQANGFSEDWAQSQTDAQDSQANGFSEDWTQPQTDSQDLQANGFSEDWASPIESEPSIVQQKNGCELNQIEEQVSVSLTNDGCSDWTVGNVEEELENGVQPEDWRLMDSSGDFDFEVVDWPTLTTVSSDSILNSEEKIKNYSSVLQLNHDLNESVSDQLLDQILPGTRECDQSLDDHQLESLLNKESDQTSTLDTNLVNNENIDLLQLETNLPKKKKKKKKKNKKSTKDLSKEAAVDSYFNVESELNKLPITESPTLQSNQPSIDVDQHTAEIENKENTKGIEVTLGPSTEVQLPETIKYLIST